MRLADAGREGQLVLAWFDLRKLEVTVDWSWGDEPEEHKTYKERFGRYRCFRGIEEAPSGPFDAYLLTFQSASGDGKKIGVSVGREFYDRLPFRGVRDAICTYAVRPGFEGVPKSTGQLVSLCVVKEFSPECPARMVGGRLVIEELSEAVPDVAESAVDGEAVPAAVPDREVVKAVARVEALVPEPVRGHPPVGRKLKLGYIPGEMFAEGSFDGLCLGEIETYRIVRTFAKEAGRGSKFYYNQVGGSQLRGLLEARKADMLVRKKDEKRREVEKMSTGRTVVKEYVVGLMKRGLLDRVSRGWPKRRKDGRSYVSRYQVAMSEPQRFKMMMEGKKKRRNKRP